MGEHQQGYPVIVKCEDLVVWLLGRTEKFPRVHRSSLSARVEGEALDLLACLTKAAGNPQGRRAWLDRASEHLDALRILVRLTMRLRFLSRRQYEHFAGLADEIGRMIGGWLRSFRTDGGIATRRPGSGPGASDDVGGSRETAGVAGRVVEQQSEQLPVRQPQQERPDEPEQQQRVPGCGLAQETPDAAATVAGGGQASCSGSKDPIPPRRDA